MRRLMLLIAGLIVPALVTAQLTEEWIATYNGPYGGGAERGQRVVCDASGYVYACGYGEGQSGNNDYITTKVNPATGETLWVRYYNGSANGDDRGAAIAVDNSGGVYVTGSSAGSGTGNDYVTVKYDASSGAQVWFARYNYSGAGADLATAIAVDASGVYVTGYSQCSTTGNDYATIKYRASDGGTVWSGDGAVRYSGLTTSADDRASAIAVDAYGVYVTGYSTGSGTGEDYATVSYSTSDGAKVWEARYNYASNRADRATAIAVDASGVYVTGFSTGASYGQDYATIKYNLTTGAALWSGAARYDGPAHSHDNATAIAVDASGVYVTGFSTGSGTGQDYATVKYNLTDGTTLWSGGDIINGAARYNYSGAGADQANAIAVDNAGGVYVTGSSVGSGTNTDYATIKYNSSDGSAAWTGYTGGAARYNGTGNGADVAYALAVVSSGGVYVAGSSYGSGTSEDYATVKYDASSGTQGWVARLNRPKSRDFGQKIACDADGYVYACGNSTGPSGTYDYVTVKYTASGDTAWVRYYDGPGSGKDEAYAIAVDNAAVYVTGRSPGSDGDPDYATVKYDKSSGAQCWVARYDGAGHDYDEAYAVAVDNAGGVYVTGYSVCSGGNCDYATVNYTSAGAKNWDAIYDGPAYSDDLATAIAVDNSGGVYVTGYSTGTNDDYDYATIKYNSSDGSAAWTGYTDCAARHDGENGYDEARAIAVDNAGGVYVTGYVSVSGTNTDYATIKYNSSDGSAVWTGAAALYDGGNGYDGANAIAVDNSGGVYVTGFSGGSGTGTDYATIRYNSSDGSAAWTGYTGGAARYNGPGNGYDAACAIAVDNSGGVYVTGYSTGLGTGQDYATVQYDANNGGQLGAARYDGTASSTDQALSIAAGPAGCLYVTGHCINFPTSEDIVTIKYRGGSPLEPPVLVSPEDGATGQELFGRLVWTGGADYFDVFLDTDNPPTTKVSDNQTDLYYDYSGLAGGATYYWQVVASNGGSEVASETWSFATGTVDAGVTEIVEPSGIIDILPETPKAVVRNFGTLTRDVAAWFEIRDSATNTLQYSESYLVVDLEGKGEYLVTFPTWDVPAIEGRYYSTSWTELDDDMDPSNDATEGRFAVEADPEEPANWTSWPDAPAGPDGRDIRGGAAMATDGDGLYAYLLKGNKTCEFYRYDPDAVAWSTLDPMPERGRDGKARTVREGGTLAQVGGRFYATKGGNCLEFWEYDPAGGPGHHWTQKADVPAGAAGVFLGASAAGQTISAGGYVYLLKGSGTFEFYRYDVTNDNWEAMATAPGLPGEEFQRGSTISFDGVDTVFALKGGLNKFYAYSVSANTWLTKPDLPLGPKNKQAKDGAAICYHLRNVYCIKGSNSQEFWIFNCDADAWAAGSDVPLGPRKSRVQEGGALVYCRDSRYLFATKGSSLELWSYGRLSNFGVMSPEQEPVEISNRLMSYRLEVTPTVVTNQARIAFALPQGGNVDLALYDAAGRLARILVRRASKPGVYAASFAASELARGVYILRYRSGEYETARKLIIQ